MLEWTPHCWAFITCAGKEDTKASCSPPTVSGLIGYGDTVVTWACFTVSSAHMYIIDYDRNIVYEDKLSLVERPPQSRLEQQMRLEADLASRLTSPVISTIFNAKQLAFQR